MSWVFEAVGGASVWAFYNAWFVVSEGSRSGPPVEDVLESYAGTTASIYSGTIEDCACSLVKPRLNFDFFGSLFRAGVTGIELELSWVFEPLTMFCFSLWSFWRYPLAWASTSVFFYSYSFFIYAYWYWNCLTRYWYFFAVGYMSESLSLFLMWISWSRSSFLTLQRKA